MKALSWVGLVAALGGSSLACSGTYEVGGSGGTGGGSGGFAGALGATAGAAPVGGSAAVAGSAPIGGSSVGGAESCVPPGQPSPVPGPLASPSVVWGRLNRLILGPDASPPSELPDQTTTAWVDEIVTQAFAQARVDGEAPGAHAFVQEWLTLSTSESLEPAEGDPEEPAELARNWGVPLLQQEPALEILLVSPVAEHRVGVFSELPYLTKRPHIGERGAGISELVFGRIVPPPPALEPTAPAVAGMTRRQEIEATVTDASCTACHAIFQPLGFALGHFDEVGEYIDQDDGLPVDTSGTYTIDLVERSFAELSDLAPYVVDSCEAQSGFAIGFLRAALRMDGYPTASQPDFVEQNKGRVAQAFFNSTHRSYEDLVRAFAQTPAVLKP